MPDMDQWVRVDDFHVGIPSGLGQTDPKRDNAVVRLVQRGKERRYHFPSGIEKGWKDIEAVRYPTKR